MENQNIFDCLFKKEDDTGNIEYKFHLLHLDEDKISNRVSQMLQRLEEGNGECLYELGITDDGEPVGLPLTQLNQSIETLNNIASKAQATTKELIRVKSTLTNLLPAHLSLLKDINPTADNDSNRSTRYICEFLIRRKIELKSLIHLRVAVAGNVDAGKSTTIGVLSQSIVDDGDGFARQQLFNHKHELQTGRSSSIGMEILGFNNQGESVNDLLKKQKAPSWPEVLENSSKVVTFFDLCGHEKYFHTTVRGLTGSFPDYCMVLVGANMGIPVMTIEHMLLCMMKEIPLIIVFTKIDMAPKEIFQDNLNKMHKKLKAVKKQPQNVTNLEDIIKIRGKILSNVIVPIIAISNKNGQNIDLLKHMLNLIPAKHCSFNIHNTNLNENEESNNKKLANSDVIVQLQNVYNVFGIGVVVLGYVKSGIIFTNDFLMIGPFTDQSFIKVKVKSIQMQKVEVKTATPGQMVCVNISGKDKNLGKHIKRGMILKSCISPAKGWKQFKASVEIIGSHATTIKIGYEPIINVNHVQQATVLRELINKTSRFKNANEDEVLRNGDKAEVIFELKQKPVQLETGQVIVFREGKTRGVGKITELIEQDKQKEQVKIKVKQHNYPVGAVEN